MRRWSIGTAYVAASTIVLTLPGSAMVEACTPVPPAGEFAIEAHGIIRGSVLGSSGEPLESISVVLRIPEAVSSGAAFNAPSAYTDAHGRFWMKLLRMNDTGPSPPSEFIAYLAATALPPRYLPRPGTDSLVRDSTVVTVRLGPTDADPPESTAQLALPIP